MAADDISAGGGIGDGGSGGTFVPPAGGDSTGGGNPNISNPATVDINDDTLVRVPGQKDPVKYGDLYRRQQADYTKKTTEAARLKEQYEREHRERLSKVEQQESYLKNLAATLLAQRNAGQHQGGRLEEIKSLPYIDGATAYELLNSIQTEGIGGVVQAIGQRDKVIQHLYGQLQGLAKQVQQLTGARADQTFDTKIRGYVKDLGYPDEAVDLAKEIYLAYEGDDLDQEFPTILSNRWTQITNAIRAADGKRAEAARGPRSFPLAGRGGQGVPGKTIGLKGNESSKEQADFLWDYIQSAGASDRT